MFFCLHEVDLVLGGHIVILWLISSEGSENGMGTIMLQAKNKKAAIFKAILTSTQVFKIHTKIRNS